MSLVDSEGLESVTIRRLASDLGVTPMALYWYFRDKNLLMEAVAEQALAEVEVPDYPDRELPAWDVRLADLFTAMVTSLRRHPKVAPLVHRRLMECTPGLAIGEVCFAALGDAGFSKEEFSYLGAYAMNSVIALVTMQPFERGPSQPDGGSRHRTEEDRLRLEMLALDRFPHVRASAALLTSLPENERAWYSSGINVLVSGIKSLRSAEASTPRPA